MSIKLQQAMNKELTDANSSIERQNILNNKYAIEAISNEMALNTIPFEGKSVLLKEQVAKFFEVSTRTIDNYLSEFDSELQKNGYELLEGKKLATIKLAIKGMDDHEIDFAIINKSARLGIFDFRAFLNIAMLMRESQRAAIVRKMILDIAIDSITKRAGSPKYINQRSEGFLNSIYRNQAYRQEFTNALDNYVSMGPAKYAIYTDKIYVCIFAEKAKEYRSILKISKKAKIRETMYSEVLDLISSFENGIADELKNKSVEYGRKLTVSEVDRIFNTAGNNKFLRPLIDSARQKMASRDLAFRDVLHQQLQGYIAPLDPEDFEKFLGKTSKALAEQMDEARDVLKRLKEDPNE